VDIESLRLQESVNSVTRDFVARRVADANSGAQGAQGDTGRLRGIVLARPGVARRLTEPPFSLARPEQWTGFIPPYEVQRNHGWEINEAPIRRQIVLVCYDALVLEVGKTRADAWAKNLHKPFWTVLTSRAAP
jgi:hypothetical protein